MDDECISGFPGYVCTQNNRMVNSDDDVAGEIRKSVVAFNLCDPCHWYPLRSGFKTIRAFNPELRELGERQ